MSKYELQKIEPQNPAQTDSGNIEVFKALELTPMTLEEKEQVLYTIMDKYIQNLPNQGRQAQEAAPGMYLSYEFFSKSLPQAASMTAKRIKEIKEWYQKYCELMNPDLRKGLLHSLFFMFFEGQREREIFVQEVAKILGEKPGQKITQFVEEYGTSELVYMAPNLFPQFDLVATAAQHSHKGKGATNRVLNFLHKISKVQNSLYRESTGGGNTNTKPREKTVISPRGNAVVTLLDDGLHRHIEILGPVSKTKGYPIMKEFRERIDVKKAKAINKIVSPNALSPIKTILRDVLGGKLGVLTKSAKDDLLYFARNADRPIILDNKTAKDKLYYDIQYHNPSVDVNDIACTHGDFWNHLLGIATIEKGMPTMPGCEFIISVGEDYSLLYNPNSQDLYATNENNIYNQPYGFIAFNYIKEKEFAEYQKV